MRTAAVLLAVCLTVACSSSSSGGSASLPAGCAQTTNMKAPQCTGTWIQCDNRTPDPGTLGATTPSLPGFYLWGDAGGSSASDTQTWWCSMPVPTGDAG